MLPGEPAEAHAQPVTVGITAQITLAMAGLIIVQVLTEISYREAVPHHEPTLYPICRP